MSQIKIDARVFDKLVKKIGALAHKSVRVGVLSAKGGNEDRDGISMVELAAIHEFGTEDIPERSFLRGTFKDASVRREQVKVSTSLAKKIINDNMSVDQALELLGTWGVSKVKGQITGPGIPPPLKPATIAAKGSNRPLVDTSRLLGAINHEVE